MAQHASGRMDLSLWCSSWIIEGSICWAALKRGKGFVFLQKVWQGPHKIAKVSHLQKHFVDYIMHLHLQLHGCGVSRRNSQEHLAWIMPTEQGWHHSHLGHLDMDRKLKREKRKKKTPWQMVFQSSEEYNLYLHPLFLSEHSRTQVSPIIRVQVFYHHILLQCRKHHEVQSILTCNVA